MEDIRSSNTPTSEEETERTPLPQRILCALGICFLLFFPCAFITIILTLSGLPIVFIVGIVAAVPALLACLILFDRNRKKVLKIWGICVGVLALSTGAYLGIDAYEKSLIIDTTPNINVHEYLPFEAESKIVKLDDASLALTGDLPVVDGAAAVFPVYSAFVHAVYPDTTSLYDGVLEYNNTRGGYELLAEKKTDIFFGAYPSQEQINYAEYCKTSFVYTPIGMEAFVFFVHKDNPVDNLTTEQIKAIYSGEVTNWSQVGGKNQPIAAYQRNEGSGSQSMLIRFMGDTPIMEPPTEMVNTFMDGIIEQVADYRSKGGSIGFSFRYYMEGIIKNPDVKLLSIDGIAPTPENIRNGTYPITTYLYAVTYEGNDNENVARLLQWVLSDEGQHIISETGYTPIKE